MARKEAPCACPRCGNSLSWRPTEGKPTLDTYIHIGGVLGHLITFILRKFPIIGRSSIPFKCERCGYQENFDVDW